MWCISASPERNQQWALGKQGNEARGRERKCRWGGERWEGEKEEGSERGRREVGREWEGNTKISVDGNWNQRVQHTSLHYKLDMIMKNNKWNK
jgi:hypothetical protein